jgi:hypothetical protein
VSNSLPAWNKPTVLEVFETLFNRDHAGATLLVTEPHSTQRTNGGRAMSSPVVGSRNALKRNAMRFAAPLLVALASLVAGPTAGLAAGPQHHDQVPGFYRLKVGDLEVTALLDGPAVLDLHWLTGEKATLDGVVKALHEDPHMLDAADIGFLVNTGKQLILVDAGSGTWFGGGG